MDDEQEVTAPVVFQCRGCREVLTDSNYIRERSGDLGMLSFTAVVRERVVVGDSYSTSQSGPDRGSTFLGLSCARCRAAVGRVYKTTAGHLDALRDCYTLDVAALQSYMLGTCDMGTDEPQSAEFRATIEAVAQENTALKSMMVVLANRISALERRASSS